MIKEIFELLMKLNKFVKLFFGIICALPISILFSNEMLANHLSDGVVIHENLLACGGGGGGGGGNKPGALKTKKLTTKINFKKKQLSKKAAAGEDTSALKAEIKELESKLAEMD